MSSKIAIMKIDEIRPKGLNKGLSQAYKKDLEFYRSMAQNFVERTCPACQSTHYDFLCKHDAFNFVKCIACRSIFMNPGPTEEIVKLLYQNSNVYKYWGKYIYQSARIMRERLLYMDRLNFVLEILKSKNKSSPMSILEIGAGTGDFAEFLLNRLPNVKIYDVLEPNPEMTDLLKRKNLSNTFHDINEIQENNYDLILGFEVIEHVLNPRDYFIKFKKIARNGGTLILSTPNSMSLEVQLESEFSSTLDIEHISILSPIGVAILAERNGFEIVTLRTPGQLDVELLEERKIEINLSIKNESKSKLFVQEKISELGFSSHLKVACVRKY